MNSAHAFKDNWTFGSGTESRKPMLDSHGGSFSTLSSGADIHRMAETLHPLWSLKINDDFHSMAKAVVLRVVQEGGRYYAENEYLDVCGYGSSPGEALKEAIADIAYYQKHYTGLREDEVVGYGLVLQARYSSLFS